MVGSPPNMVESPGRRRSASAAGRGSLFVAVAVLGVGGGAALILLRHPVWAGVCVSAGGAALSWASLLAEREPEPRSRFFLRVVDPAFDAVLLAAIAWSTRHGSIRTAVLALVGLGASYVASYERARAGALGYRTVEAAGYRATRTALLVAGLLSGLLEAALWAFAALTVAALGARAANVTVQERGTSRVEGHP